jgi:ABC-2 type transport system ATP-binding protein
LAPPLLEARDLRLDEHGVATIDGLALETEQDRVVVVGAPRVLFDAACGLVRPSRGAISVRGTPSAEGIGAGVIAGAPLDPPLPPDWTPLSYTTWSARLAGFARGEAEARASSALEKLGMRAEARAPLGRASLAARRGTSIAAALATGARVIALEDPSPSLEDEAAGALLGLVARALEGRDWILFAARASLVSPLVASAGEALVFSGSMLAARGAPAELAARGRRYAVDAQGAGEALAARVRARGLVVESLLVERGAARFVVELPEGATTGDLFACAAEAGAVVVELRPIARAFA